MTNLTRRAALLGTASAALAPALATQARAATPPAGKQAPGFYRYKVGDYECTSLSDGANTFAVPNGWVRNISQDEAIKAADEAYMPKGMVVVPFNPQIVNTGSKLVLFDTGFGPSGANPKVGHLVANMAAAGIDPKAIDIVVLSHLHPDHANGIKDASGALVFPNAEIKLPAKDWAFWMSEENAAKAANDMMKNYFAGVRKVFGGMESKITKYDWGQEVAPGVTALDTNGHTPGHTSFAVASGNSRVLIQSDVTNIPEFFLRHPDWHVAFDVDPVQAVATRKKFYDMAAAEKAMVIGFHFPFPSMGCVEKDGTGYRLVPVAWNPVI
jgi:glyoxylase-like metal-dependent hydrolase (beta-lactamase superfamily II)